MLLLFFFFFNEKTRAVFVANRRFGDRSAAKNRVAIVLFSRHEAVFLSISADRALKSLRLRRALGISKQREFFSFAGRHVGSLARSQRPRPSLARSPMEARSERNRCALLALEKVLHRSLSSSQLSPKTLFYLSTREERDEKQQENEFDRAGKRGGKSRSKREKVVCVDEVFQRLFFFFSPPFFSPRLSLFFLIFFSPFFL